MQRTENDALDDVINTLEAAVLAANLQIHDYVLSHGGELQNRDYFSVRRDTTQLKFLKDFFTEEL